MPKSATISKYEGGCLRSCLRGGSVNIVVRRFDGVGPQTAIFSGFQRLIPYLSAEKNPDQNFWFFMEKIGFRFLKCSRTIDLLRIYYVKLHSKSLLFLSKSMVLEHFENLNPLISKNLNFFWSGFFSAQRYGMSRRFPLLIVVRGPTQPKRRTTIFTDPPHAASQTTT